METVQTETATINKRPAEKTNASSVVLKGSVFTLPIVKLSSSDLDLIEKDLTLRLSTAQSFFNNAPVVIDLEFTHDMQPEIRFTQLEALLRKNKLVPVGVQNGSQTQNEAAIAAGLAILTGQGIDRVIETKKSNDSESAPKDSNASADQSLPKASAAIVISDSSKMVRQPIRSGQRMYAKGGDLVLLGAVNAGAEVMADGNLHIYAPLRGRALAGLDGDSESRIFCQSMEAELVAIAGNYRVFEDDIPEEFYKKPVQIYLEGEQLKIVPLG
ncbi:septum site-determining protein MinC [Kaarinaea lacus]